MFEHFFNMVMNGWEYIKPTRRQENKDVVAVAPDIEEKVTDNKEAKSIPYLAQEPKDKDIQILEETYGELKEGMVIELDLKDAAKLMKRNRIRSDAFSKLQRKLTNDYGVSLIIKTKKNYEKKDNKNSENNRSNLLQDIIDGL